MGASRVLGIARLCMAATLLASPVFAVDELPIEPERPAVENPAEVRDLARSILSDPAFDGFEHFDATDDRSPTSRTYFSKDAADEPSPPSESGNGESPPQSPRPKEASPSRETQSDPDAKPAPQRTSESRDESRQTDEPETASSPSATKSNDGPPRSSLRGRDGIERPVRYVPRVKEKDELELPDWNFDLGWDLRGLDGVVGLLLTYGAYVIIAAVAALILVLVTRAVMDGWRLRSSRRMFGSPLVVPLADDRSPGEIAADVYLQRAMELAAQGNYGAALGQLVLGSMSAIERQQWIRYRRGLTLHDYLRSVRSRPQQFQGLRTVIQTFEPIEYGRRPANPTAFETALHGYQHAFGPPTDTPTPSALL